MSKCSYSQMIPDSSSQSLTILTMTTSNLTYIRFKTGEISFNDKKIHPLHLIKSTIPPYLTHRDLGVYISSDLSWNDHHNNITAKAYRTMHLIRRTFGHSPSVSANKKLYISLIRSQVTYCSPLWRPHCPRISNSWKTYKDELQSSSLTNQIDLLETSPTNDVLRTP